MDEKIFEQKQMRKSRTGKRGYDIIGLFRRWLVRGAGMLLVSIQNNPWYVRLVRWMPHAEVEIVCRSERAGYRFSAFRGNREIAHVRLEYCKERICPGWWILSLRVGIFSRSHGIGRRLIRAVIDFARKHAIAALYLHVYTDNAHGIRFYESEGFRVIPFTEEYGQRSGRMFVCMQCAISKEAIQRV